MKGLLRKQNDGWSLENEGGEMVKSGSYPLVEDPEFIESAADALDHWKYHDKPYSVVDERESDAQ